MPAHKIDRLLTGRGLARHLGVTENAVREARATGRLDRAVVRQAGRIMFDPTLAEVEWRENVDPLRVAAAKDGLGRPISAKRGSGAGRKRVAARLGKGRAPARNGTGNPMAEARARRAQAQAVLAEMEIERRTGALSGPGWGEHTRLLQLAADGIQSSLIHVIYLSVGAMREGSSVQEIIDVLLPALKKECGQITRTVLAHSDDLRQLTERRSGASERQADAAPAGARPEQGTL